MKNFFTKYFFQNPKGQTLIEALVALGLIGVITSALVAVVITSFGNSQYSKNQSLASQLAQQGLEIVRQNRDSNYAQFKNTPSASYCLAGGSTSLESSCPSSQNADNFFRQVIITQSGCAANVAKVVVKVSWQDSKCTQSNLFCHSVSLSTCLSVVNPVTPL